MTALQLLAYICAALLLQLSVGTGILVRRKLQAVGEPPNAESAEAPVSTSAWPGWREFRVVRREFEDAAHSQCSFYLQPVDGAPLAAFLPGQYLTFALQIDENAVAGAGRGQSITRCYSLSDRPDPGGYRITIKRAQPHGLSSGHFHDRVHEGDVIRARAPAGRFFIDPDASIPAVFIAGGIGITPMMSMLRWCVAEQPTRTAHLFYGVRSSADHAFKQTLEALALAHPAFHLHVVYSSPGPDDKLGQDYQHTGHANLELLRSNLPPCRHRFYVCGPPPMMQSLVPALRAWGVQEVDIQFEAFGPATVHPLGPPTSEPPANTAMAVEVRFTRSGRTLAWDGQDANLLDFAERHHVAVDSGCRSGSCGSCETRLVTGTVRYAERPDHDIAPGHCLLCVGKPQSSLVLEA